MRSIVKHTRIAGICTAVPSTRLNFFESNAYPKEEMERIYANTGISEIRVASPGMIVSDMCTAAAERLIERLGWERSSIELLVLVTQGPDFQLPATACLLQERLGLPTSCAAFDVNLGCSGYVYGLWMVSQLLAGMNAKRALLLVGDRPTGGVDPDDRATVILFGDAGAATAVERSETENPVYYVAGTDGRGAPYLNIKVGRDRYPFPFEQSFETKEAYEEALKGTKIHLNGAEVFGFTLRTVPALLRETLDFAGLKSEDIDHYIFHQANKFILDHLVRKIKIPQSRVPVDLDKWGNTSSTSIPLTICDMLGPTLSTESKRLCMAGFGVGWSWAANIIDVGPLEVAEVYEIPKTYRCGWESI